jgi:hypothetical protein
MCLAAAAILALKATGATGAAIVVAGRFLRDRRGLESSHLETKETQHGNRNDGTE